MTAPKCQGFGKVQHGLDRVTAEFMVNLSIDY